MTTVSDETPDALNLANALLELQDNPGEEHLRPQAHWDMAARTRDLSLVDLDLLALAPMNRARLEFSRHKLRQAFFANVANSSARPRLLAAASTAERSVARFEPMGDFAGMIMPFGNDEWMIVLDVLAKNFPPTSVVSLWDCNDREWMSGIPDSNGRLARRWTFDGDPRKQADGLEIRVDGQVLS